MPRKQFRDQRDQTIDTTAMSLDNLRYVHAKRKASYHNDAHVWCNVTLANRASAGVGLDHPEKPWELIP